VVANKSSLIADHLGNKKVQKEAWYSTDSYKLFSNRPFLFAQKQQKFHNPKYVNMPLHLDQELQVS
jgi:hypothetical protein